MASGPPIVFIFFVFVTRQTNYLKIEEYFLKEKSCRSFSLPGLTDVSNKGATILIFLLSVRFLNTLSQNRDTTDPF